MKKYMIAAATLFLFAGVTNAQDAKKKPSKPTTVKHTVAAKPSAASTKSADATTTSVSPTAKKATSPNAAIKRKHLHKKVKTTAKTGAK
jgi:hypothetical protein